MASGPGRRLLAAALATGLLALAGCSSDPSDGSPVAGVSVSDDDGLNGVVLPQPYDVPALDLRDTSGAPYDVRAGLGGKPLTLVFFGYTNCPDICGMVMANIATALTRLDDADRAKVAMVFVTTDPARDDEQALRSYVTRYDPDFEGLTGPLPRIERLGTALGVPIAKGEKLPTGGYDVNHGTQIIGAVPGGSAPVVWTQGTSPGAIAEDITTILRDGVPTPPEAEENAS